MKYRITIAIALFCSPAAATPRVVTDILPIHSLVSQVMDGIGTPENLLDANASPHGYALRPSQAEALAQADLVFWVGPELTPWLDRVLSGLAGKAQTLALIDTPDTIRLAIREGAAFDTHDHHEHEHHHDGDAEERGAIDPHAWLDPENARVWLSLIAEALSASDPENADRYTQNAVRAAAEIGRLTDEIAATLEGLTASKYIVFHDAYHYFEARFDVEAAGAIALNDATTPGPRRLREIQNILKEQDIHCVFSEPQFNPRLIKAITDGSNTRITPLDPMGGKLEAGPSLYPGMMRGIAEAMAGCLKG